MVLDKQTLPSCSKQGQLRRYQRPESCISAKLIPVLPHRIMLFTSTLPGSYNINRARYFGMAPFDGFSEQGRDINRFKNNNTDSRSYFRLAV